jgi:hypothetical protein
MLKREKRRPGWTSGRSPRRASPSSGATSTDRALQAARQCRAGFRWRVLPAFGWWPEVMRDMHSPRTACKRRGLHLVSPSAESPPCIGSDPTAASAPTDSSD